MAHHLLSCSCGKDLLIEPRQAGEIRTCECGLAVEIPTLREIKLLPVAHVETGPAKTWGLEQGITFACGAAIIFVALVCLVVFLGEWMRLDTTDRRSEILSYGYRQIDGFQYVDGYKFWLRLKLTGIGKKTLPEYVRNQRRAKVLESYMVICGVAVGVGGLVSVVSLFLRRRPQGKK